MAQSLNSNPYYSDSKAISLLLCQESTAEISVGMGVQFNLVFCDDLEGWDGGGGGREVQEGGDVRDLVADSPRCMAEANTILESNYSPINNKF